MYLFILFGQGINPRNKLLNEVFLRNYFHDLHILSMNNELHQGIYGFRRPQYHNSWEWCGCTTGFGHWGHNAEVSRGLRSFYLRIFNYL